MSAALTTATALKAEQQLRHLRHADRKRRGDFIAVSVVNTKPQISADDFSILQFIGSNLAFAATAPVKMLPTASTRRGRKK
jgi:hypothetical protein